MSEHCLTLNVWSQSSNTNSSALKPVMFWVFGGGLGIGSIFQSLYNGSVLATKDVVFVSTNYRLGALGFLYANHSTAPGHAGFHDQNLALKWVGDPEFFYLMNFQLLIRCEIIFIISVVIKTR